MKIYIRGDRLTVGSSRNHPSFASFFIRPASPSSSPFYLRVARASFASRASILSSSFSGGEGRGRYFSTYVRAIQSRDNICENHRAR